MDVESEAKELSMHLDRKMQMKSTNRNYEPINGIMSMALESVCST